MIESHTKDEAVGKLLLARNAVVLAVGSGFGEDGDEVEKYLRFVRQSIRQ